MTKECKLTKEKCDRLEELRIGIWDNTFAVQKNSKEIKNKIGEIEKLVVGTEQNKSLMSDLNNMKNTADFLTNEPGAVTELYRHHDREFEKPYRQFGYFNNIIHDIKDRCRCDVH